MAKLTDAQKTILAYMANKKRCGFPGDEREEGYTCAIWIAEGCGHFYDTPWAGSRLPGLTKRGLVERGGTGFYRITSAGRSALENSSHE